MDRCAHKVSGFGSLGIWKTYYRVKSGASGFLLLFGVIQPQGRRPGVRAHQGRFGEKHRCSPVGSTRCRHWEHTLCRRPGTSVEVKPIRRGKVEEEGVRWCSPGEFLIRDRRRSVGGSTVPATDDENSDQNSQPRKPANTKAGQTVLAGRDAAQLTASRRWQFGNKPPCGL